MSDLETVSVGHHRLPVLSHDNFADWEIVITSFLTGASDHVRVIEQRPDAKNNENSLVDPVRPTTPTDDVAKWGESSCRLRPSSTAR